MIIPMVYDFSVNFGRCFSIFAPAILASIFLGGLMILSCRTNEKLSMPKNDLFLLVVSMWICTAIVCAFPFYVYPGIKLKFMSALFEAVSGVTTTGATVYQDVEILPKALNLWRFILHFIGGVGIVAIGIVVLPIMRIGGMQLFQTENSDKSQKFFPRASQTIRFFIGLYILLIGIFVLWFRFAGMTLFDAVCHGISVISTGGFSTRNAGLIFFSSDNIKIIASIGMLIGGFTFLEIAQCFQNGIKTFLLNKQTVGYLKLITLFVIFPIIFTMILDKEHVTFHKIASHVFTTISAITTTGLDLSNNFMPSDLILIILAIIGGCSGSTTGGIKIFRIQILLIILTNYIKKLIYPYDVSVPKYQTQRVSNELSSSVISFLVALVLTFLFSTLLLEMYLNIGFTETACVVSSCLFNWGIPISDVQLPAVAKLILILDMIAGRLEVVPLFIILVRFVKK